MENPHAIDFILILSILPDRQFGLFPFPVQIPLDVASSVQLCFLWPLECQFDWPITYCDYYHLVQRISPEHNE